jgi:hypothetical protein
MPPSGWKTIVSSPSAVTLPRRRSGKKTKKPAFQFANAVDFARAISGAVMARGASLPRCTRPFAPSKVSIVE